jgi:hypothetical protein
MVEQKNEIEDKKTYTNNINKRNKRNEDELYENVFGLY